MGYGLAALVIAVVGAGVSAYQNNQAAGSAKRARQAQRKQQELKAARARREEIRKARIAQAAALTAGEAAGASTSSGVQGGVGSIQSQALGNLSFLDQMNALSDQAALHMGKSISTRNKANIFASISSAASSSFGYFGGGGGGGTQTPAPIEYKGANPNSITG